jgi:Putative zinc-finger
MGPWMMGMIQCREASLRLSLQMEDSIGPSKKLGLIAHLAICAHCRRFSRQVRVLRKAFRLLGKDEFDAPKP